MSETTPLLQSSSDAPNAPLTECVSAAPTTPGSAGGIKAFLMRFVVSAVMLTIAQILLMTFIFLDLATVMIPAGLTLVSAGDALINLSLAKLPSLKILWPLYRHHLRTAWLGNALLHLSASTIVGAGRWVRQVVFGAPSVHKSDATEIPHRRRSPTSQVLAPLLVPVTNARNSVKSVLINTIGMAVGILILRWWNGGSIDEVTADPIRSITVLVVGATLSCIFLLKTAKKFAELAKEDAWLSSHDSGEREAV